jgi:hypothetical protein
LSRMITKKTNPTVKLHWVQKDSLDSLFQPKQSHRAQGLLEYCYQDSTRVDT